MKNKVGRPKVPKGQKVTYIRLPVMHDTHKRLSDFRDEMPIRVGKNKSTFDDAVNLLLTYYQLGQSGYLNPGEEVTDEDKKFLSLK